MDEFVNDERTGYMTRRANTQNVTESIEEYTTSIIVAGIDEYNNNVIEYNFIGCVPQEIGGIS